MKYWFKQYDKDGSGKIGRNELRQANRKFGWHFSDYEIDQMIWNVDKSGDGKINFKEFVKLIKGKSSGSSSSSTSSSSSSSDEFTIFDLLF